VRLWVGIVRDIRTVLHVAPSKPIERGIRAASVSNSSELVGTVDSASSGIVADRAILGIWPGGKSPGPNDMRVQSGCHRGTSKSHVATSRLHPSNVKGSFENRIEFVTVHGRKRCDSRQITFVLTSVQKLSIPLPL